MKTKVRENGELVDKVIETVAGRVLFNEKVPEEVGFVNELLTKKKLQKIIANVVGICGIAKTAKFLDDIKELVSKWLTLVVYQWVLMISTFLITRMD